MGLCPKPRKFFEKNLTKNFHTGKVFGVHISSNIVLLEFYASGKIISSPTMNIKNAPYRRGGYYPPEYNKKRFSQENLPKLFIFHYSMFIIH